MTLIRPLSRLAIALLLSSGMTACHPTAPTEEAKDSASSPAPDGITLSAEQIGKIGIVTVPARAGDYSPETVGYGVVMSHDAIAVAVAELATAEAALGQSRAAAARLQSLAGTAGAMSADAVEAGTRQVATDAAALALAERRLSAVVGTGPPGGFSARSPLLQDLANGKVKLLRATFTLGASLPAAPDTLRAAPLDGGASAGARRATVWTLRPVWSAPADTTLPGRSYFAVLKESGSAEGERLLVRAPGRSPVQRGVIVPGASLVISDGAYWCYVEASAGHFVRRPVATDEPQGDDYFVTQGVAAGDRIVTAGAALLLAREMNPSTEAD